MLEYHRLIREQNKLPLPLIFPIANYLNCPTKPRKVNPKRSQFIFFFNSAPFKNLFCVIWSLERLSRSKAKKAQQVDFVGSWKIFEFVDPLKNNLTLQGQNLTWQQEGFCFFFFLFVTSLGLRIEIFFALNDEQKNQLAVRARVAALLWKNWHETIKSWDNNSRL